MDLLLIWVTGGKNERKDTRKTTNARNFVNSRPDMNKTSSRSAAELLRRYIGFVVSLFVIALGTSLSIRANLGSSPISCPPYVLSMREGAWSMGTYVICMHIIFIILQILILRKNFQPVQFLQLGVSLIFGVFTDITMWMTYYMQVGGEGAGSYVLRVLELLLGNSVLAAGIAIEVKCDVLVLAGEGFPLAISKTTGKEFGKVKICTDFLLVLAGFIFMMIFFRSWHVDMIGVGTVISVFLVGYLARVFGRRIAWMDGILIPRSSEIAPAVQPEPVSEVAPLVITISREYGSGGREIGSMVAKELGIPFYDKEFIDHAAKELGLTSEVVAQSEQNISNSTLWNLIFTDRSIPASMNPSKDDAIFVSQSRAIRALAQKGSCVLIGRCANWVLKGRPNILRVFICADKDTAAERIMQRDSLDRKAAEDKYEQINRARANHYWQYTGQRWSDSRGYDIVINTARTTYPRAASIIRDIASSEVS